MTGPQKRETPRSGGEFAGEITERTFIVTDAAAARKAKATLAAKFAMQGHEFVELADGTFACSKWGLTKLIPDLPAAEMFYRQIGGEA